MYFAARVEDVETDEWVGRRKDEDGAVNSNCTLTQTPRALKLRRMSI